MWSQESLLWDHRRVSYEIIGESPMRSQESLLWDHRRVSFMKRKALKQMKVLRKTNYLQKRGIEPRNPGSTITSPFRFDDFQCCSLTCPNHGCRQAEMPRDQGINKQRSSKWDEKCSKHTSSANWNKDPLPLSAPRKHSDRNKRWNLCDHDSFCFTDWASLVHFTPA